MKIHELKTVPPFFNLVESGVKKFEMRINDRDYQVGDVLHLREYVPQKNITAAYYTGRECLVRVTYILTHGALPDMPNNFVIMSIELLNPFMRNI